MAYEWSNLLLACNTCNIKKSNHFPVAGNRVTTPPSVEGDWLPRSATMLGEKPLVLNPEVDDPTQHLLFKADGVIAAKNNSPRGVATINICHLNREELRTERKKMVDWFRKLLKQQTLLLWSKIQRGRFRNRAEFDDLLEVTFKTIIFRIHSSQEANRPFSRLGWHINADPEGFLLAAIPAGKPRQIARTAISRLSNKP